MAAELSSNGRAPQLRRFGDIGLGNRVQAADSQTGDRPRDHDLVDVLGQRATGGKEREANRSPAKSGAASNDARPGLQIGPAGNPTRR